MKQGHDMAGMDQRRRFWTTMATNPPMKEHNSALRADRDHAIGQSSHIVDLLIEERAGRLLDHPLIWQGVRQFLYPLLKYDDATRIADDVAHLSGFDAFSLVCREFGIRTRVDDIDNALALLSDELREITVFNELLNKRGARVGLTFGPPIDPNDLPNDAEAATSLLQHLVKSGMATPKRSVGRRKM